MYTDEDLEYAVSKGVFTSKSVEDFRDLLAESRESPLVDEENFKLLSGFNDIFVVIACILLLVSVGWAASAADELLSHILVPITAWGLAEFFVRVRKMALPAILLLLTFVGGIFSLFMQLLGGDSETTIALSGGAATIAAVLHWVRFKVPITVAAGVATLVSFIVAGLFSAFPEAIDWLQWAFFVCGIATFMFAMRWDMADRKRVSHRSDVAFWLHLLSAPMIVHPVFTSLGILQGEETLAGMVIVCLLYGVMTLISIAVDRRAFMVSSLAYVLYALSGLFENYGMVGYNFAATGIVIGSALLLLSAFWHSVRAKLVGVLPTGLHQMLPATS